MPLLNPDRLDPALAQLRRSVERFVPLPDAVWAEVRQAWRLHAVARGTVLTQEGETERRFALIVEGVHRVSFTTAAGAEHTVAFGFPGDYSGIPDSFFLRTPSAYRLDALTDGLVLCTDPASLLGLMERHRDLERWAWRLFATALAGRAKRERDQLTLTAEERYRRLLDESPQVLQHLPLRHVASYLGMTPETLSRVRASRS